MRRDLEQELGLRQAREAARESLEELGSLTLPIDIEGIVRAKDIDLRPLPPERSGCSGAFVYASGASGITGCGILYASSVPSEGFRRYTIAHEYGHYTIPKHGSRIVGTDGHHYSRAGFVSDLAVEREADTFAAEFLMPKSPCRDVLRRYEEGMASVIGLAEACAVSLPAAAFRYAELTSGIAAVILCEGGLVQACFRSSAFRQASWSWSLRRGSRIPLGSPTKRLWDDPRAIGGAQALDGGMRWSDWFDGAPRQDVYEEAKGLGSSYGKTITVLSLAADEELEGADDD